MKRTAIQIYLDEYWQKSREIKIVPLTAKRETIGINFYFPSNYRRSWEEYEAIVETVSSSTDFFGWVQTPYSDFRHGCITVLFNPADKKFNEETVVTMLRKLNKDIFPKFIKT